MRYNCPATPHTPARRLASQFVNFGTAGVKVSCIALGLGLRGQSDAAAATRCILKAIDSGIYLLDFANVNDLMDDRFIVGRSEAILSRAVKSKRDDLVITLGCFLAFRSRCQRPQRFQCGWYCANASQNLFDVQTLLVLSKHVVIALSYRMQLLQKLYLTGCEASCTISEATCVRGTRVVPLEEAMLLLVPYAYHIGLSSTRQCVPNFEHMIWYGDFDFVLHFQASDNAERARLAAAKVSSMLYNYLGGAPLSRAEVLDRPYDRAF